MSDCHSSLGSARSKRRSGCSLAGVGSRSSRSPSSCRIRRTSLSDTPSASKRRSTSRMRRVPYSGCSFLTARTASRLGSTGRSPGGASGGGTLGISAPSPPFRYRLSQSDTVVAASPKTRATSRIDAPSSATSFTARSRNSTGCVRSPSRRPGPPPPRVLPCLPIPSSTSRTPSTWTGGMVLRDSPRSQALIRWHAAHRSTTLA